MDGVISLNYYVELSQNIQLETPPRAILINAHFSDYTQFESSVKDWDLDFKLLGKQFDSFLHYSQINNTIVGDVELNCKIEQHGACPEGMRTFVVPADEKVFYKWRDFEICPDVLQLFPKNGELFSISKESFHCYVVSVPYSEYYTILKQQCGDQVANTWDEAYVWTESRGFISHLRNLCEEFKKGNALAERALVYSLIGSLTQSNMNDSIHNSRFDIVTRAVNYLKRINFDLSSAEELISRTGCSERSLQYAFNAIYGVSPMTYVKRSKLNLVYNQLIRKPDISISEVANVHGFWHMGQFAKDFRIVYGMLPSELKTQTVAL